MAKTRLVASMAYRRAFCGAVASLLLISANVAHGLADGPSGAGVGDSSAVDGVDSSADVSLFTGAAQTSIPISVPPGRNGMQPNLSLNYSHQSGSGPYMGVGWNLAIPRIERSRKHGVPGYDTLDTYVLGLEDSSDLVALDSQQTRFAAEVDEAHQDIRYVGYRDGKVNFWEVRDTSGKVYRFGETDASKIGRGSPSQRVGTFAWHLTSIEDPNGNTIDFHYEKVDGVSYPTSIAYGGNPDAGLAHTYTVGFSWLHRGNLPGGAATPKNLSAGYLQTFSRVLSRIDVYYLPDFANGMVRSYRASWGVSKGSGRPLLKKVQLDGYENGNAGQPVPFKRHATGPEAPWEFEYFEVDSPAWEEPPSDDAAYRVDIHMKSWRNQRCNDNDWPCVKTRDFIDLNGDGLPDAVSTKGYIGAPDGDPNDPEWAFFYALCTAYPDLISCEGEPYWEVWLNRGPNAAEPFGGDPVQWRAPGPHMSRTRSGENDDDKNGTDIAIIDMNGDGLQDYVRTDKDWDHWKIHLNTGFGFEDTPQEWPRNGGTHHIQRRSNEDFPDDCPTCDPDVPSRTTRDLIDLNGDGLPDRVSTAPWTKSDPKWDVWWNNGQGFVRGFIYSPRKRIRQGSSAIPRDLFDINSDGLPDIVRSSRTADNVWEVWYGTGTGFMSTAGVVAPCNGVDCPVGNTPVGSDAPFIIDSVDELPNRIRDTWRTGTASSGRRGRFYKRDLVDLNGDSFPDIVTMDATLNQNGSDFSATYHGRWKMAFNHNGQFAAETTRSMTKPLRNNKGDDGQSGLVVDLFDIDGNGYLDSIERKSSWDEEAIIRYGHGKKVGAEFLDAPADALVSMRNPVGMRTQLSYDVAEPNAGTVDGSLGYGAHAQIPFPAWVVSEVDRDNGGNVTTYAYSGGYYDRAEREFRGFHLAVTKNLHGVSEQTRFHQTKALAGKRIEQLTGYGATGVTLLPARVMRKQSWQWQVETLTAPTRFFPTVARTDRTDYLSTSDTPWSSGAGGSKTSSTAFAYDSCGNLTVEAAYQNLPSNLFSYTTITYVADADLDGADDCDADRVCTGICDRAELVENNGYQKQFSYDSRGNARKIEALGEGDSVVNNLYDAYGNLVKTRDPRGVYTRYDYDSATRLFIERVVSDEVGRDALQETVQTSYDKRLAKAVSRTDASGAVSRVGYDEFGRKIWEAEPGDTEASPTRRFKYRNQRPTQAERAAMGLDSEVLQHIYVEHKEPNATSGYVTEASFADGLGRPLQTQRIARIGRNRQLVVDGARRYGPTGLVDHEYMPIVKPEANPTQFVRVVGNEPRTTLSYDQFGRVLRRTMPDGSATTTSYRTPWATRTCDAMHAADIARGSCEEVRLDAVGQVVEKRTFLGNSGVPYSTHEFNYVLTELQWERQNGDDATKIEYTYDGLGRRATATDPDSGVWSFEYDEAGNLIFKDDPKSEQHLRFVYDNMGRLLRREQWSGDSLDQGTRLAYADFDYYTRQDPWSGGFGRGRLQTTAAYDCSSGDCFVTSQNTVHEYDQRGNILESTQLIAAPGELREFTTTNRFDGAGRLVGTTVPFPGGLGVEELVYNYSPEGALLSVSSSEDHRYVHDMRYDEFGRVVGIDYANGLQDGYNYYRADGEGQVGAGLKLKEMNTRGGSALGTVLRGYSYVSYDANGNPLDVRDEHHASSSPLFNGWIASYDDASRLTSWLRGSQTESYAHDQAGNLTRKENLTLVYGGAGPHQPTEARTVVGRNVTSEALSYDANGNMVSKGDRVTEFDAEGRVVKVCEQSCDLEPLVEYRYDANGTRVLAIKPNGDLTYFFGAFDIQVGDADADGSIDRKVVRHIYAAGRRIASSTVDEAGTQLAWSPSPYDVYKLMFWGLLFGLLGFFILNWARMPKPTVFKPLVSAVTLSAFAMLQMTVLTGCIPKDAPENTYFYHPDQVGSTELVTNEQGAILEYSRYTPYGDVEVFNPDGSVKSEAKAAFQFTGQRAEEDTGLIQFAARYYDPELGMFLSHDPAEQYFSPYSYGGGNPFAGADPDGQFFGLLVAALVIGALSATATAIDALVQGASIEQAFKSASIAFAISFATAIVGGVVGGALSPEVAVIVQIAQVGYGAYNAAKSFQEGRYASGALGVAMLGYSAAKLGNQGKGATGEGQISRPGDGAVSSPSESPSEAASPAAPPPPKPSAAITKAPVAPQSAPTAASRPAATVSSTSTTTTTTNGPSGPPSFLNRVADGSVSTMQADPNVALDGVSFSLNGSAVALNSPTLGAVSTAFDLGRAVLSGDIAGVGGTLSGLGAGTLLGAGRAPAAFAWWYGSQLGNVGNFNGTEVFCPGGCHTWSANGGGGGPGFTPIAAH